MLNYEDVQRHEGEALHTPALDGGEWKWNERIPHTCWLKGCQSGDNSDKPGNAGNKNQPSSPQSFTLLAGVSHSLQWHNTKTIMQYYNYYNNSSTFSFFQHICCETCRSMHVKLRLLAPPTNGISSPEYWGVLRPATPSFGNWAKGPGNKSIFDMT
jgi:hypothetical protein